MKNLKILGNYGLIAVVLFLVSTGLNAAFIWLGMFGFAISVLLVMGFLFISVEVLKALDVPVERIVFLILGLLIYVVAIVAQGNFGVSLAAALFLLLLMWLCTCQKVSFIALCCASYVLGIECAFFVMGDEIPADEMKVEYLAFAVVVATWLVASLQKVFNLYES